MTGGRPPFERIMPGWVALSLLVHAVVFAGASLLPRGDEQAPQQTMRVVVAGAVQPPELRTEVSAQAAGEREPQSPVEAPQVRTRAQQLHAQGAQAERARRAREEPRQRREPAPEPRARPARKPLADPRPQTESDTRPTVGDRLAAARLGSSASAPRMGRPGAAVDGPLAGGGARPIARTAPGPASFAVAAPEVTGGSGVGLGGSGAGIGAGGSARGIGGSGTPGGTGLGTGGEGGSGTGRIAAGGTVGHGPGRGSGAGSPPPTRPAPAPRPRPEPKPDPQPEADPEPEPEPQPEPQPTGPSQADLSRFRSMVQSRINSARRYPTSARQQGWEGTTRVSFSIAPSGNVSSVSVVSSSGYPALDNEAIRAVRRAGPYKPFPRGLDSSIRVTATVAFRLR